MKRSKSSRGRRPVTARRVKVSGDGKGVVSHAGVGMLREIAESAGLSAQLTDALADTYDGPWRHDPAGCSPTWP